MIAVPPRPKNRTLIGSQSLPVKSVINVLNKEVREIAVGTQ